MPYPYSPSDFGPPSGQRNAQASSSKRKYQPPSPSDHDYDYQDGFPLDDDDLVLDMDMDMDLELDMEDPNDENSAAAKALAADEAMFEKEMRKSGTAKMTDEEQRGEDFRRYLAGQSVMKSGLSRDQSEVNKIIEQASLNSKFFKHQQQKNKDLEIKVAGLIKHKDQLMKNMNLERLEKEADELLIALETKRDLSQTIVHVDLDAFYANVEQKKDPSLKGKAFGVGSGVLTTASYEARKYGCRSGMAGFVAKALCPGLICVKPDFAAYSAASREVQQVLLKYDSNLAMASMDEGYLNITSYMKSHSQTAEEVITQLRAEVEEETGLTISAGIAPNKMLAKICSDKNKPNGHFALPFESKAIRDFMKDLPVRSLPGIGRVAERYLQAVGVKTCGDIYKHRGSINALKNALGFHHLMQAHLGIYSNIVEPGKRQDRKSVGCERTFRDMGNSEEILAKLEEIAHHLEDDLEYGKWAGRTVVVKYKLHTYQVHTRQKSAGRFISKAEEILPIARELLIPDLPLKIRLLGIRLTQLKDLKAPERGVQKWLKKPNGKLSKTSPPSSTGEADDDVEWLDSDMEKEYKKERDGHIDNIDWPDSENEKDIKPKIHQHRSDDNGQQKRRRTHQQHRPDDDDDDIEVLCPVCQAAFKSGNPQRLNQHINTCLDKQGRNTLKEQVNRGKPTKVKASTKKQTVKKKKQPRKVDAFAIMMNTAQK